MVVGNIQFLAGCGRRAPVLAGSAGGYLQFLAMWSFPKWSFVSSRPAREDRIIGQILLIYVT